jgi:tRNA pseudouridine55 synthase
MTSAQMVARVKKLLGARKVGHTGTLDPFATGVLVCCVNQATKIARFLLHGEKRYQAVLHLGVTTDTQDVTGTITSMAHRIEVSEAQIRSVFKQFEGTIEQYPPVFSALKHKGTPLYKLARSGKPVQKPARQVCIAYNRILDIDLPYIRFEVGCSGGTYIRTLCADIGTQLGYGGHLRALRRIESSGFKIEQATEASELDTLGRTGKLTERVVSMADALRNIPEHVADYALTAKIRYGNIITRRELPFPRPDRDEDFIKIVDTKRQLVAVLHCRKEHERHNYCCVIPK